MINKAKLDFSVHVKNKLQRRKLTPAETYDVTDSTIMEIERSNNSFLPDEPIIVGFINLYNAKQRMMKLKYDFIGKIVRPLTNRAFEMNTDSMFLAMTECTINECMAAE